MKYYIYTLLRIVVLLLSHQTLNAMLEKSVSASFKTIALAIREKDLKKASLHLKNTFLSIKECCDLIKIIAAEGDSDDHVKYIKELYIHAGTLSIKKLKNKKDIKSFDDDTEIHYYKTGESIIAQYRKIDCNRTDIAYALIHDHPTIFTLLLEANNKKFLKKHGCNLVQNAIILGRTTLVHLLLAHKNISINCTIGEDKNSIWHTAAKIRGNNSIEIFEILKKYYETTKNEKFDFSIHNDNKETPLMVACGSACRYVRPEIINYLLEQKSDPNTKDITGDTPLHRAALWGCEKTISLLLRSGGNPEALDKNKNTPLHIACNNLNIKAAYILMRNKKNLINAQNKDGQTALHLLLKKINLSEKEIILQKNLTLFLLNIGAFFDILNKKGIAPLHYSENTPFLYSKKYLKHIEKHNKKLNWSLERNDTGDTLLHQLIKKQVNDPKLYKKITQAIQFLLDKKVSPNHENKKKETPLTLIKQLLEPDDKKEKTSKDLHEYYSTINVLLLIAQTLQSNFEKTLSKETRNSLRTSLKKNNF